MHDFNIKNFTFIVPLAIIIIAIVAVWLLSLTKSSPNATKIPQKTWAVIATKIYKSNYTPNVQLYAKVESPNIVELRSSVTADVMAVYAKEGQVVAKDKLLIQLDERDSKILVDQRNAEITELQASIAAEKRRYKNDLKSVEYEKRLLTLAQRAVDRQEELLKGEHSALASLEDAEEELHQKKLELEQRLLAIDDHKNRLARLQAQLARAKALYAQAKLALSRNKIYSPFHGKIISMDVAVGDRVQRDQVVVNMYDIDEVELRAQIPSQYIPRIRQSLTKNIKPKANATIDGEAVCVQLDRLAGQISQGRAGVDGLFKILTKDFKLALGRSVEMILDLPTIKDIYSLPSQALYGRNRVYKVVNNQLVGVPVEQMGKITDDEGSNNVLVRSSKLKDGDIVVTSQLPNAVDGLKVSVLMGNKSG